MDEMERSRVCPTCATIAAPSAAFCSSCGARLPATAGPTAGRGKWYHNIWFVLAILFLIAGPFGLPLVWKNPRLPRWAKAALTAATVLYTLLLINTTLVMVQAVMKEIGQFTTTLP